MIAVEYLGNLGKASTGDGLGALLAQAQAPFDRPEWWLGLAEHCGFAPIYAAARGREGLALLPLCRTDGRVEALANWYTFRWRPLITAGADGAALIAAIARDLKRSAWAAQFSQLPGEDGTAEALAAGFRAAGWQVSLETHDVNHVLAPRGRSWAEFLASRPGQLRTTLKRKSGRVACAIADHFDAADWDAYAQVYAASWKPTEGSLPFLRAFAEAEGAAGRLRLGIARIDGNPVAAQLWTVEGGTAFIHKLAHREDARAHSPGSVLSAALFAHALDRDRVSLIDFGTGDDPYKRDWMEDIRVRYRVTAYNRGHVRSWPAIARGAIRRLVRKAG